MTVTTPPGRVQRDEQGARLEFVRHYDEPVEAVWVALTAPAEVARWLGTLSGDPATGALLLQMSEGGDPGTVDILQCEPPLRLLVDLPSEDGVWRLSATLAAREDHDGGTTLVVTQRLAEPYDASSIGPGWHYYLDRMGAVVTGTAVPEDFDAYYPALSRHYAVPG